MYQMCILITHAKYILELYELYFCVNGWWLKNFASCKFYKCIHVEQWSIALYDLILHVWMSTMGLLPYGLTLWSRDLCLLFGLRFNGFIGDPHNHIRVVATLTTSLVLWINWGLNSLGQLAMTIYLLYWGTGVVLQVSQNYANPTKKGLRTRVDRIELNYDLLTLIIIYYNYNVSSRYTCRLRKELILYSCLWFINLLQNNCLLLLIKLWTYTSIYFPPIKHSYFIAADSIEDRYWESGQENDIGQPF